MNEKSAQQKKTAKRESTSSTLAYFKNGIGNWVLMTPALQALASMDASGKILLVTDSAWDDSRVPALREMWAATPWIERVYAYPREVWHGKPERVYYSRHSESSEAMQWIQGFDPNFGNQIDWTGTLMHERDYYLELVRRLGYKGPSFAQSVPVGKNPAEGLGVYIAICNGAFGEMQTQKQWPHFKEFAKTITDYYGLPVVGVGNGKELSECAEALTINYAGKLSILDSAAVVKGARLFVTTDTGMMHVADALDAPQVVLFGGTVVGKNGPMSRNAVVVRAETGCQPCQYTDKFTSCSDARCMRELTVGKVMAYVRNIL